LALFGSTSPSYLILQSLDAANRALAKEYSSDLSAFILQTASLKSRLVQYGYTLSGNEPLKLTISTKLYGYTGYELAQKLEAANIVCEFADPDFVVCMLTPEIGAAGLESLEKALCSIPRKNAIQILPPVLSVPVQAMTVRQAVFSVSETIPAAKSAGRILSAATVGCPPAVPIVVCGERINEDALHCFDYYGIETCTVIKE
jgi:arginine/lysine/ornithine decarboxylase